MEILQLKYFFESAKTESFSKTAEKYIVPTSSVSASVRRLEKELGCNLFDRHSNSISLNSNGKRMMQALYIVFNELEKAAEDLAYPQNDTREIKLLVRALRDDITDYCIAFEKKHPHIAFKITLDFKETDFEKYDIIIDEKNDIYKEYEKFTLRNLKLKLVADRNNSLCKKRTALKRLSAKPFISWGEESNMHKILIKACNKAGFIPNISVTSNDMKCHEKLIKSGIGIGLIREDSPLIKCGDVKIIDAIDFDEAYTVCCYYKSQADYGNVKSFLNFLKNIPMP